MYGVQDKTGGVAPVAGVVEGVKIQSIAVVSEGSWANRAIDITFEQPNGGTVKHRAFELESNAEQWKIENFNALFTEIASAVGSIDEYTKTLGVVNSFAEFAERAVHYISSKMGGASLRVKFTYKENSNGDWFVNLGKINIYRATIERDSVNPATVVWNPKYDVMTPPASSASADTEDMSQLGQPEEIAPTAWADAETGNAQA